MINYINRNRNKYIRRFSAYVESIDYVNYSNDPEFYISLDYGRFYKLLSDTNPTILSNDDLQYLYTNNASITEIRSYIEQKIYDILDGVNTDIDKLLDELNDLLDNRGYANVPGASVIKSFIPVVIDTIEDLGWTVVKQYKHFRNPYNITIRNSSQEVTLRIYYDGGFQSGLPLPLKIDFEIIE